MTKPEDASQFLQRLASVVTAHKTVIKLHQYQLNTYPHEDPRRLRVVPYIKQSKLFGETLSVSLSAFLQGFARLLEVFKNADVQPNTGSESPSPFTVAGTDSDWDEIVSSLIESLEPPSMVELNSRANLIDPMTHEPIHDADAAYLEANVRRIARRAYKRQTLESMVARNPFNPVTGQPFSHKNIKSFSKAALAEVRRR